MRRFRWTGLRIRLFRERWLTEKPAALARQIGCSVQTLYRDAPQFGLPPRDPVKRAMAQGTSPRPAAALAAGGRAATAKLAVAGSREAAS